MTITPAYGRDYKSAKAAKADYYADKDFIISDFTSPWDGKLVNKSQLSDHAGYLNIRYNNLTKITRVA